MPQLEFVASTRKLQLFPAGTEAVWGNATIQCDALMDLTGFIKIPVVGSLVVYFLLPDSPDPGPQYVYHAPVHKGAVFASNAEFTKWADVSNSGKKITVTLETSRTKGYKHFLTIE